MNWSLIFKVVLVILVIVAVVLVGLYFMGNKLSRQQIEQEDMMEATKQVVSLIAIDKKKMKVKDAGLPPVVYENTPWYARRVKVPIVKAKIGPKIVTMLADDKAYQQLPLKTEAKAVISGLYIMEVKSARGGLIPLKKKKSLWQRIKGVFVKDDDAKKADAAKKSDDAKKADAAKKSDDARKADSAKKSSAARKADSSGKSDSGKKSGKDKDKAKKA